MALRVMTDGAGRVLVSDGHIIYKSGVFKEEKVVDRTGSGDAFGARIYCWTYSKRRKNAKKVCLPADMDYVKLII